MSDLFQGGILQMSPRIRLVAGLTLGLALFVAACSNAGPTSGSSGNTSTGNSSSNNSTTASTTSNPPTATSAKSKPTSVPVTTVALCTRLVSFAEANQLLSPPNPINSVDPGNSPASGNASAISTCQYLDASRKVPLLLAFGTYPSGVPLSTFVAEAAGKAFGGATITANQPVSGVGDQAWFLAGSKADSGITAAGQVLYVVDGSLIIIIEHFTLNGQPSIGSSDNATIQGEFVQIGNLIVSRL
jgi:hypothetical protein